MIAVAESGIKTRKFSFGGRGYREAGMRDVLERRKRKG